MKNQNKNVLTSCPECGAIWGFTEIDWQQCDACGYPDDNFFSDHDDINYGNDLDEEQEAFNRELYG